MGSETQMTGFNLERFTISKHDNGYYCVSIPSYEGGTVVRAETYDARANWQPIETAPRDSTWILAAMRSGRRTVVRWGGGVWEDDNRLWRDPTHWMPLPDPPEVK
jgi:hypothetical protein